MQLTLQSDYSLRVLIYLGSRPGSIASVSEISQAFSVSRNHLTKVVHQLGKLGYITTHRGKTGGVTLDRELSSIRIGDVVRDTEPSFRLAECFEEMSEPCALLSQCGLKSALGEALEAFFAALNRYTLADLVQGGGTLAGLTPLRLPSARAALR